MTDTDSYTTPATPVTPAEQAYVKTSLLLVLQNAIGEAYIDRRKASGQSAADFNRRLAVRLGPLVEEVDSVDEDEMLDDLELLMWGPGTWTLDTVARLFAALEHVPKKVTAVPVDLKTFR